MTKHCYGGNIRFEKDQLGCTINVHLMLGPLLETYHNLRFRDGGGWVKVLGRTITWRLNGQRYRDFIYFSERYGHKKWRRFGRLVLGYETKH